MLKKFLLALVALCLVMVAGGVRAEVNSRVFAKAGGDGWPALETQLKKDGMLTGEVIQTNALEAIAYGVAKSRNFIPKNVNDDEVFPQFVNAFRGLNGIGDTITVAEFRALATGNGIYLPEYTGEVSTAEKTGSVEQPSTIQFVGVPDSTERLERQIAELRKQLAQARIDVRNSDAQVAALAEKRLKEHDQQLAGIKGQLEKLPSTAKVDELSKQVADVSALLTEIPGLKKAQAEQATTNSKLWLMAGGAGVIGVLAILVALIGNLRVAKTRVIAEEGKNAAGIALSRATRIDSELTEVDDRLRSVEETISGVVFDHTAVSALQISTWKVGSVHDLTVNHHDGRTFTLELKKLSDAIVDIKGIAKRLGGNSDTFTCSTGKVIGRIHNAGNDNRIVGTKTSVVHLAA